VRETKNFDLAAGLRTHAETFSWYLARKSVHFHLKKIQLMLHS